MLKDQIAIVVSRFNLPVTEKLAEGALQAWQDAKSRPSHLQHEPVRFEVPGAFEIPLMAQKVFAQGAAGVVALGAVIKGETDHYQYICQAVTSGLVQVQLQVQRPVGFGVLTAQNSALALARAGGPKGNKGAEAMQAVLEVLSLGN